ncbi:translation initiation factor IF-2-like, partial [Amphibalanus amphitrite]|uniref:translation initiation factor IF-2-like n=1 Tax=Amphibalanus amphitrite TaxID=1232801 RepID=UPI001C909BB6
PRSELTQTDGDRRLPSRTHPAGGGDHRLGHSDHPSHTKHQTARQRQLREVPVDAHGGDRSPASVRRATTRGGRRTGRDVGESRGGLEHTGYTAAGVADIPGLSPTPAPARRGRVGTEGRDDTGRGRGSGGDGPGATPLTDRHRHPGGAHGTGGVPAAAARRRRRRRRHHRAAPAARAELTPPSPAEHRHTPNLSTAHSRHTIAEGLDR